MPTAIQMLAMDRAFKEQELKVARSQVKPGKYSIDMTLRIHGEVSVADDTSKTPTSSTPWLTAMALVLRRSGIQRDRAIEMIMDAVKESITMGDDAEAELMEAVGVAEVKARLTKEYARLPKTPVNGAVKATLHVENI